MQRHAVAILFDVLRDFVSSHNTAITWQQQQHQMQIAIAIMNAGVYSAVQNAMNNFSYCEEIKQMSQQILLHLPKQERSRIA